MVHLSKVKKFTRWETVIDKKWNIQPSQKKALMIAKKQLAELVYDAVNLEGIPFTLPEIQTLLDGITDGGHKLSDQQIALNQKNAWLELFQSVSSYSFELSIKYVCKLHSIAAKEDALEWGVFRKGKVTISGTDYEPLEHNRLESIFHDLISESERYEDVYDWAIHIFLQMDRTQFLVDVNKRMGRFMMNGILLEKGNPIINLPVKRQLEFNTKMIRFYDSGEEEEMNAFLRDCLSPKILGIMRE
jgi:prophage maintenance system killer protein